MANMTSSQAVTESLTFHVKQGMNLGNDSDSPDIRAFSKLTEIIKAQPGVKCQYWVFVNF